MKKFTISLFTFMFALACTNREDNEYKKNAEKYIGEYSAFSMTSDTPIDANFDGAYNTNLFEEFSLSVRIMPIRVWYNKDNSLHCDALMDHMSKPPITTPSDYTIVLTNPIGVDVSKFNFKILKANPILNRDGTPSETKIIDFKIIDQETIQLKFNHNLIYDVSSKEWKTIKIDAVYKKK